MKGRERCAQRKCKKKRILQGGVRQKFLKSKIRLFKKAAKVVHYLRMYRICCTFLIACKAGMTMEITASSQVQVKVEMTGNALSQCMQREEGKKKNEANNLLASVLSI